MPVCLVGLAWGGKKVSSEAPCVDRGRLGGVLCRCAVGIGEGRVVSDAVSHCDLRGSMSVWGVSGVIVPSGLVGGV